MGRLLTEGSQIATLTTVPIGGYADVVGRGERYRMVGDLVSKSDFPEFTNSFDITDFAGDVSSSQRVMKAYNSQGVAYGNGVIVAAGTGIQYSVDGVEWQTAMSPITGGFDDVIFANGKFVAVGYYGNCYTSVDGINWTSRTIPNLSSYSVTYHSIAYGNGLFVATPGGYSTANNTKYATSPDGITWTLRDLPVSYAWTVLTFGANKFVLLADRGGFGLYSSNGINWYQMSIPVNWPWFEVNYANGLFVAVASGPGRPSTDDYITSTDGITWTARKFPFAQEWGAVDFIDDVNVWAVLGEGSAILISDDAINWQSLTIVSSTVDGNLSGYTDLVSLGGGRLFAVAGNNGNTTVGADVVYRRPDPDLFFVPGDAGKYVRMK